VSEHSFSNPLFRQVKLTRCRDDGGGVASHTYAALNMKPQPMNRFYPEFSIPYAMVGTIITHHDIL